MKKVSGPQVVTTTEALESPLLRRFRSSASSSAPRARDCSRSDRSTDGAGIESAGRR